MKSCRILRRLPQARATAGILRMGNDFRSNNYFRSKETSYIKTCLEESSIIVCRDQFKSQIRWKSVSTAIGKDDPMTLGHPEFVEVPMLPFIGSVIPQHSGIPPNMLDPYNFWIDMRKKFGDFYKVGIPTLGRSDDLYRSMYVIKDPKEMMKVVRAGGAHPSGIVELFWANKKWMKSRGLKTTGFLERGEEWKRLRTFMQTDLLHPDSAREYLPGILEAARLASKGAAASQDKMNYFLGRCAFDMFSSLMFGELTQVADPTSNTDPENALFVEKAHHGLGSAVVMVFDPKENLIGSALGIETKLAKEAFASLDVVWEIGQRKINAFLERKKAGTLDKYQQASYLSKALDRQAKEGSNVTVEETCELAWSGLFAAVDTTSSGMGWNLLHIARLPEVQEKVYKEISMAMASVGNGRLTGDVLEKSNCPYFHAVLRETHRLTPLGPVAVTKVVNSDTIDIHGKQLEKGDVVVLESYSLSMDPDLIDDPEEFRPERWLDDAVESRKGTSKEIIDHPFFKTPFSQGARRCPGSRVAANEMQVMVAQLLLDWKISVPIKDWREVPYKQLTTVEAELPTFQFEPRI